MDLGTSLQHVNKQFRPRIRTVLLVVNIIILLLPLFGIRALRLYENELVQRTESSLINLGIAIKEMYLREYLSITGESAFMESSIEIPGLPVLPEFVRTARDRQLPYEPILPRLDIYRETIFDPAEEALVPEQNIDSIAQSVGQTYMSSLMRIQRSSLVGIRIVDQNGIVVSTTKSELGMSLLHREEVIRALTGENISLIRKRISDEPRPPLEAISRGAGIRIFVALPIRHENRVLGAVILSRTPMDIAKAMYYNRFMVIGYLSALVIVVLLVSFLTATTISRPIQQLIDQTRLVKGGKYEAAQPLVQPGALEIGQLSESVYEMATALSERAEYIQTFARNVSHEFKTPLASIQGTVELLADHMETMNPGERKKFFEMITTDAKRMERLVSRLLVLAKADMISPGDDECTVGSVIPMEVDRFRELGLKATFDLDQSLLDTRLKINAEILETLVSNLLENVRQHVSEDAKVHISARRTEFDGRSVLEINFSDNGPGISPANQSKIFSPFFTTDRVKGRTGLGLSIVRSMVESHGGNIRFSPGDPTGSCFILVIPVA